MEGATTYSYAGETDSEPYLLYAETDDDDATTVYYQYDNTWTSESVPSNARYTYDDRLILLFTLDALSDCEVAGTDTVNGEKPPC